MAKTAIRTKGTWTTLRPRSTLPTGTLTARALFENKDRALLPGLFVRVRTPIAHQDKALLVKAESIGTSQEGSYLLVVNADNVVERKSREDRSAAGPVSDHRIRTRPWRLGGDRRHSARLSRGQGRSAANLIGAARGRAGKLRQGERRRSGGEMNPRGGRA